MAIQFRKEIFESLDAADADIEARINCGAKTRCKERLAKARVAANEGNADTYRYFWMAAQAASQAIPPVTSAGIWSPSK